MPQNGRRTRYDDSNWMQEFLDIMDNGGLEKYQARMARNGRNAPALPGSRPVADVPARNERGTSSADGNWMQEFLDIMDNGGLEKYQANMARRNNPNASGRSGERPASGAPAASPGVNDTVARHSRKNHSGLTPWKPEPKAPVPYYILGVRPLDDPWVGKGYGHNIHLREQHTEHMQFLGSDGGNFGMMKEEGVTPDKPKLIPQYKVDPTVKYNKQLIDEAREIEEKQWQKEVEAHRKKYGDSRFAPPEPKRYNPFFNNCQDYIQRVLDIADELGRKKNIPLLVE